MKHAMLIPLLLAAGPDPASLGAVSAGTVRVYLVRHGEAFSNLTPAPDMPEKDLDALTEKGKQQALAAGAARKSADFRIVLHSPTARTRETGMAIVGNRSIATPGLASPRPCAVGAAARGSGHPGDDRTGFTLHLRDADGHRVELSVFGPVDMA